MRAEAMALLEEQGLEKYANDVAGSLPYGIQRRLEIARALATDPKLLLLDEHTAALDPKTAAKVLEITDKVISENRLTTLMVTHNMRDAIDHGNRLIMMSEGKVVVDVKGEDKKKLTVEQLVNMFSAAGGKELSDKAMLSN